MSEAGTFFVNFYVNCDALESENVTWC